MRATTVLPLFMLLPCLGACGLDFQIGQLSSVSQAGTACSPDDGATDNAPPVLTLLGPPNQTLTCGTSYVDPGAIAMDVCAGDLTAQIVRSGSVNTGVPATYALVYSATDPSGNTATVGRTVVVTGSCGSCANDVVGPTITLLGPINQTLTCGTSYVDPGATATDACAGDLTAQIVRSGAVNTGVPGTYSLAYTATDPSGNSTTASRTVTVTGSCGSCTNDVVGPTITLQGPPNQTLTCGASYVDPGATAMDACAGDLTAQIVRSGSVNTGVLGTYSLAYTATDPSGNSTTASRTVTVTGPCGSCTNDVVAPTITLLGPPNQTLTCGTSYVDPGATAMDACAGDLTAQIVRSGSVNTGAPGIYSLAYTATDPSGNSTTASRTVVVAGPCSN